MTRRGRYRRDERMTMEDAAYVAAAWAGGESLWDIAPAFGHPHPSKVTTAIKRFLLTYVDNNSGYDRGAYILAYTLKPKGDARKALVPAALVAFRRARGDIV